MYILVKQNNHQRLLEYLGLFRFKPQNKSVPVIKAQKCMKISPKALENQIPRKLFFDYVPTQANLLIVSDICLKLCECCSEILRSKNLIFHITC